MRSFLFFLGFAIAFLAACSQQGGTEEDYRQIEETSAALENSSVYVLDSHASWIEWKVQKTQGPHFLQGKLRLTKGSVVVEKGNVIAGFLESDVWKNANPDSVPSDYTLKDKALFCDSFPRACSPSGSRIRFDLEQSGRFVVRSEFRQDQDVKADSGLTHQYQFKLTLADSTLPTYCQVRQQVNEREVRVDGLYKLQVRDFGIFVRPRNPHYVPNWYTEIPMQMHLVFRKKNKSEDLK